MIPTADVVEIDWRDELRRLEPFIVRQGGIVAVTGQEGAASAHFEKVLKARVRGTSPNSVFVKLNPNDESTRSEVGIVSTFEKKLGVWPPEGPSRMNILTDVEAGRDIRISHVAVGADGPFEFSDELRSRTDRLIKTAADIAREARLVVILFNWHRMPQSPVHWFASALWEHGLDRHTRDGLLLICIDEQSSGESCLKDLDLEPDIHIRLPALFHGSSLEDALTDLAHRCQAVHGDAPEAARARAETLMAASGQRPAHVLSGLVALRLTLQGVRE